jgi:hypothetical protein
MSKKKIRDTIAWGKALLDADQDADQDADENSY